MKPVLALLRRLLWAAALVLPAFGAQAAVVVTSLHSFQVFTNGENLYAGLAQASDGNFYGTTSGGGAHSSGSVFKISTNGVLTSLYSFAGTNDGANPHAGLVQGSDGNFYGTTGNGGTAVGYSGKSTVFRISTNGALTTLYSFTAVNYNTGVNNDGANPVAGLVQGSDGLFYGTTAYGGAHSFGTVFKISTNGVLTPLHSFTGGTDGMYPEAGLVQGNDGNFYGTTSGYASDYGTVFKITSNGALTTLRSFTGSNDGGYPEAGLVQGSDGNFYGTTGNGGTNGSGTVFKISTNGALTSLYSFTGGTDGANPHAGLVQGSDGNFYGTTFGFDQSTGSWYDNGTVFKSSTNGALTTLHSFLGGIDGQGPSGLVQGSDGNFYGTTEYGGTNDGRGTVFKITTNGALTSLYSFTGGNDGGNPQAGLVQGSDGYFYGTTAGHVHVGNSDILGCTVFKISTNGALTTLHSFSGSLSSPDGVTLNGLVQGRDGYLYGTTSGGGTNSAGTVFKISTNGTLTTIYAFGTVYTFGRATNLNGTVTAYEQSLHVDGAYPEAGLVQGSDGYFYGTTSIGGNYSTNQNPFGELGYGTVFQISTNGSLTTLYSFTGGHDGGYPRGGLVQGRDGSFYGTTSRGGQGGGGTVFRLTIVPEFQAVTLTNGTLNLTWSTEAGGRYQLQYLSDLNSSNWTNLTNAVTAAGATLSTTDSVTNAPRRFYRVVLLP